MRTPTGTSRHTAATSSRATRTSPSTAPRRAARPVAAVAAAVLLGAGFVGMAIPVQASAGTPAGPALGAALSARCIDSHVGLSVEESRLAARLPRASNPARLQGASFARKMIYGSGFQHVGPALVQDLCQRRSRTGLTKMVRQRGERLWRLAVDRAQRRPGHVHGWLPYSDDRPLYWTRLQATAALRQWQPRFPLSVKERDALITTFDKASRGVDDISFPAGKGTKRLILSGFDPYTLDGGDNGTAPGAAGNNIRHGNPSGAVALAVDGTTRRVPGGGQQVVQAYTLPVNYTEFAAGYLEDTVGPWMTAGARRVTASITVSQYGGDSFKLEQWNGRYHGVSPGNDNSQPCPTLHGKPQLAINNHGCDTQVVRRWGGPARFHLFNPPQWTTTSLPVGAMIRADTGRSVPRPPGDTWPNRSTAFGVLWHTIYTEFPHCSSTRLVTRNDPTPVRYPPAHTPVPPDHGSCSYSGGGGNYLSNESAYRNTLLRDRLGLHIPAGHIHTPGMQHFDRGDHYRVSDRTFNAWRLAILAQTRNLVDAVGARS